MASQTGLSLMRLKELQRRQIPPKWGSQYEPAIRATREEAPAGSRPAQVWSPKLGRYCHVLSSVEQSVLILALYHPELVDLHEQRMLSVEPAPHPLHGHPLAAGICLEHLQGTVAVAERLDYLHLHPRIYVDDGEGHKVPAPFPWVGDFLLFLRDAEGPFCVNWTVKGDAQGFTTPLRGPRPTRNPQKARVRTMARHAIEELYYGDAGIRTVRIVEADIPFDLALNLREVYVWQARELAIDDDLRQLVIDRVRGCVLTAQPPLATLLALQRKTGFSLDDLKAVMYRAIWNRELKVDLFGGPVYPDQVLRRQNEDVLDHYRHWLVREAP